jgi:hypothetical protein
MSEEFIGQNLTDAECDLIALTRFPKRLYDGESHLQQNCFFDYRYMHPVKRTYLFAHEYMKSYKALYERYIDINSDGIYGLSRPKDPLDNDPPRNKTAKLRTPTCLWVARQVADANCIPYDFYVNAALKYLFNERYYKAMIGTTAKKKIRLNIQASALYSVEVQEHVENKWSDYRKARMVWSENERLAFDEPEMDGEKRPHVYKLAYERYVAKQIISRTMREFPVQNALTRRALRRPMAEKLFAVELKNTG